MKALGHFVVIKKSKQEATKIGGIEITESQNPNARYLVGEVIAFGSLANHYAKEEEEKLKVGDLVKYDGRAGHEDEIDGEMYYILKSDGIAYIL